MRRVASCVGGLLLLMATTALAQEGQPTGGGRGQGWSVLSGQTVGSDDLVFHAEFGVPGLGLSLLYGASDRFDIGGKLSINYLYQGIVSTVEPGVGIQALIRLNLINKPKFNLGLSIEPGPYFYFINRGRFLRDSLPSYTLVGFQLPVALTLGIPVGSALMINAGLDIPFHVRFGQYGGPYVPILIGGGLEYFIDRSFAVTFNTRAGPHISNYNNAYFHLESVFGVALKL